MGPRARRMLGTRFPSMLMRLIIVTASGIQKLRESPLGGVLFDHGSVAGVSRTRLVGVVTYVSPSVVS